MVISGNISLPKKGLDKEKLAEQMERSKANDAEWMAAATYASAYVITKPAERGRCSVSRGG